MPDEPMPDEPIATAREALDDTLDRLTERVLAARNRDGNWAGELSSSALSTATAVVALTLVQRGADQSALSGWGAAGRGDAGDGGPVGAGEARARRAGGRAGAGAGGGALDARIRGGVVWLVRTQNADGGWGDTTGSPSNVSTTALCWAVLTMAGRDDPPCAAALERVRAWMRRTAGGLGPGPLADTIRRRYGRDRTFSVPILTVLALAGLLDGNEGRDDDRNRGTRGGDDGANGGAETGIFGRGWRHVPQLPFELAAVPPSWYRWLRLPVVSYALPALIAIGQARHRRHPTRNPATRLVRRAVRTPTLRLLAALQPSSGGFLEATPLTSFVVMSLLAAGEQAHPVVERGVAFLLRSARGDGSWPIDTNLATWVTTLSVNALARRPDWRDRIPSAGRVALTRWLLDQQHRERHVYTDAEPGGWAWTDLPGGVPDADDTPGALLALHALSDDDPATREAAYAGIGWLLDLQNGNGGIPTFCRGWGALPFDRSSPDLTAHTLRAWSAWRPALPAELAARTDRAAARAVRYLERAQRPDGSWIPLWFGNQRAPDDANPVYGTARVLEGLAALSDAETVPATEHRAARWLTAAQHDDGGWGGAPGVPPSIEETAVAVSGLATFRTRPRAAPVPGLDDAVARGVKWLVDATNGGRRAEAAPIGLYFARLWYSEALYPWILALGALARAEDVGPPSPPPLSAARNAPRGHHQYPTVST